ncbi:4580_t:CDS:2 [Paraglomus brasilianum]|uniref:4580_t:CDS:1 n=1 Tax=Paraglomus brasilianum TaxID=144538 RepID=A0A9N9F7Z6_9GLOM|nr:4580_t:CDS:2 [Paraglomus brasilianum]
MSEGSPSLPTIAAYQALFLFTGFYQALGTQYLYYQGAATGTSLLTNTSQAVGATLVGLLLIPNWWANKWGHAQKGYESVDNEIDMVDMNRLETQTRKDYQLVPDDVDEDVKDTEVLANIKQELKDTNEDVKVIDEDAKDADSIDRSSKPLKEHVNYRAIAGVAALDAVGNYLTTIAFFYIGSGMFQVIYSSVVIWCAILSFIFLKRNLSLVQWLSIIGVSLGLGLSALGIKESAEVVPAKTAAPADDSDFSITSFLSSAHSTMFGAVLAMISTFGYACIYVISDRILSERVPNTTPPSPEKTCFIIGSCSTVLCTIYILFYTIPNWDTLVVEKMKAREPHASTVVILTIFAFLVFASLLHNLAYYWLVKHTGNVSTGILNSLRAIVIFILSHWLFCNQDHAQCFNYWKGVSVVVVVGCVVSFSLSKRSTMHD